MRCLDTRSAPLNPLDLDRETLSELTIALAGHLAQLDACGRRCPTCGDAEVHAFLTRLRRLLDGRDDGG